MTQRQAKTCRTLLTPEEAIQHPEAGCQGVRKAWETM